MKQEESLVSKKKFPVHKNTVQTDSLNREIPKEYKSYDEMFKDYNRRNRNYSDELISSESNIKGKKVKSGMKKKKQTIDFAVPLSKYKKINTYKKNSNPPDVSIKDTWKKTSSGIRTRDQLVATDNKVIEIKRAQRLNDRIDSLHEFDEFFNADGVEEDEVTKAESALYFAELDEELENLPTIVESEIVAADNALKLLTKNSLTDKREDIRSKDSRSKHTARKKLQRNFLKNKLRELNARRSQKQASIENRCKDIMEELSFDQMFNKINVKTRQEMRKSEKRDAKAKLVVAADAKFDLISTKEPLGTRGNEKVKSSGFTKSESAAYRANLAANRRIKNQEKKVRQGKTTLSIRSEAGELNACGVNRMCGSWESKNNYFDIYDSMQALTADLRWTHDEIHSASIRAREDLNTARQFYDTLSEEEVIQYQQLGDELAHDMQLVSHNGVGNLRHNPGPTRFIDNSFESGSLIESMFITPLWEVIHSDHQAPIRSEAGVDTVPRCYRGYWKYDDTTNQWTPVAEFERDSFRNSGVAYSIPRVHEFVGDVRKWLNDNMGLLMTILGDDSTSVGEAMRMLRLYIIYAYQLHRSQSLMDITAATHQFMEAFGVQSFIEVYATYAHVVYQLAFEILNFARGTVRSEAGDNVDDITSFFAKVMNSKLVNAIRDLFLSLVSLKLFERDIAQQILRYVGKAPGGSLMEVLPMLVNCIKLIFQCGKALCSGVPFVKALMCEDPVQESAVRVRELIAMQNLTYTGIPVEGMIDLVEYMTEFNSNLELLRQALPNLNPLSMATAGIRKTIIDGQVVYGMKRSELNTKFRTAPYGIVITGDPGIGKSYILAWVAMIWSEEKGRKFDAGQIFHRQNDTDYWTGINPFSHTIYHFSEVGSETPERAPLLQKDPFKEATSLMDNLPYNLNTAFEDKGKLFARPELIVIDNNNPEMNVQKKYYNWAAYLRRFGFLFPVVKAEYRLRGSTQIDPELAKHAPHMMACYDFTYKKFVASGPNSGEYINVGRSSIGYVEAADVLRDIFREHIKRGEANEIRLADMMADKAVPRAEAGVVDMAHEWRDTTINVGKWLFKSFSASLIILLLQYVIYLLSDSTKGRFFVKIRVERIFCALMPCYVLHCRWLWWFFMFLLSISDENFFLDLMMRNKLLRYKSRIQYMISDRRDYIQHLFGQGTYNPFKDYEWDKHSTLMITVMTAVLAIGGYFGGKKLYSWLTTDFSKMSDDEKAQYFSPMGDVNINKGNCVSNHNTSQCVSNLQTTVEKETVCVEESIVASEAGLEYLSKIDDFHERYNCGSTLKRIKTKNDAVWNVRKVNEFVPHTGGLRTLSECIKRNIRYCLIVNPTRKPMRTHALGIQGSFAIMNKHALGNPVDFTIKISLTDGLHIDGSGWISYPKASLTMSDLGNDLLLIDFKGMSFTNILHHLTNNDVSGSRKAMIGIIETRCLYKREDLIVKDDFMNIHLSSYFRYPMAGHKGGDCGLPLMCENANGSSIVGLHVAGDDDSELSFAIPITRQVVEDGIGKIDSVFKVHSEAHEEIPGLEDPNEKSVFRYEILHNVTYYGKLPGDVILENKSRLKRTRYWREAQQLMDDLFGLEGFDFFERPVMRPKTIDHSYISPYNLAMRNISCDRKVLSDDLLKKVTSEIIERATGMLKERGLLKINPLSVEQAINGVDGDEFAVRINASTSGGFGWKGKKSKYLPLLEGSTKRVPTEDLLARLVHMLETYERGEKCHPIYTAKLKDEPRTLRKVREGKTRVFYMSPLDYLILSRMMLLPFYSLLVEHGDIFYTAVGIDMHRGANEFYKDLLDFAHNLLAGDLKNFDQRMPIGVAEGVARIVHAVCENFGYSPEALHILSGILSDNCIVRIEMLKDVFDATGMQPSGKYGTAEDNGLRLLILLMYAFYSHPAGKDKNFFEWLLARTYGDDLGASSRAEWFNNFYLETFFQDVFGMGYTTSTKGEITEAFTNEEEFTFLKRNFVFKRCFRKVMAPLDKSSLLRSLTWLLPSSNITEEEQVLASLTSSLWEMAIHFHEDIYNEIRAEFVKWCSELYDMDIEYVDNILPHHAGIVASILGDEEICETDL